MGDVGWAGDIVVTLPSCSVTQSCVWLFATPWTAARQASLCFTIFFLKSQKWWKREKKWNNKRHKNYMLNTWPFQRSSESEREWRIVLALLLEFAIPRQFWFQWEGRGSGRCVFAFSQFKENGMDSLRRDTVFCFPMWIVALTIPPPKQTKKSHCASFLKEI